MGALWFFRPSLRYFLIAGLLAAAAAVLLGLLFFNDPETAVWYPPCLFHEATGLYCFGCGNTRALYSLIHGDIAGSLRKNLLFIPAVLFLLISILKPRRVNRPSVLWTAAAVIAGFTLLRNLPWEPFCLLAPR